jgi:long-chain acyl-CoA synthetase
MKTFSFEVGSEQPNGGRIRRSSYFKDGLIRSPGNNIYTLFDLFENSATLYPDVKGFGYRKVKDIITEEKEITKIVNGEEVKQKKTWSYYELSGYHYMTYKEGFDFAQQVGAGLAHIGLKSKSKIEVFSPTK